MRSRDRLSRRLGGGLRFAIGFVVAGPTSSAFADPVPPPFFQVSFGSNGSKGFEQGQGNYNEQECTPGTSMCEVSRAIVSGDSFNQSLAFASGTSPVGAPLAAATATLEFYFSVLGSRNSLVPIQVTFTGATTAQLTAPPFGQAAAQITVLANTPGGSALTYSQQIGSLENYPAGNPTSGTFEFDMGVLAYPEAPTFSEYNSFLVTAQGSTQSGVFTAQFDPTISFAPGYDATGLTLVVSEVPEPGTGLLALGGVLGLAVRRHYARSASRGEPA